MGVVYRAWQPALDRQVALKKLQRGGDAKAEARFAREIRALFLRAYRFQYIGSGLQATRFPEILFGLVTPEQRKRIETALARLLQS